jgi:hypothetical protein
MRPLHKGYPGTNQDRGPLLSAEKQSSIVQAQAQQAKLVLSVQKSRNESWAIMTATS